MTTFALLRNTVDDSTLTCLFNPSTVKLSKSTSWQTPRARNAKDQPKPQFVGTGPQTLTVNLLFNAYDRTGKEARPKVPEAVETLFDWTCPVKNPKDPHHPLPPTISFEWGGKPMVTGFLQNVEIEYLLFDPSGTPQRATAMVTIQTLPNEVQGTNPTSGGITGRRSVQTSEADSLASIAQREYGDAGLWRAVAIANDVEDPGRVPPGTRLLLPPRAQAVALAAVGGDPR
jgi:hypothetical protein